MKAAILAGGEGRRLRPLTDKMPKPLIPINGVPMIERAVRILENSGIDEVVVIIKNKAEIKNYLNSLKWKIKLRFVEKDTKDISEAFFALKDDFKEKFFYLNSDLIFNPEVFYKFVNDTKDSEADLVICVSKKVSDPNHPKVIIDNKLNVIGTGQPNGYSITGISLCSPSLFDEEERSKRMGICHFLDFLVKLIIGKYTVTAYKFPEVIDINTYEDFKKAEEFLKKL